ncbi:5-carboxymethyl-2-hydroxymuconate isomerase [Mariprofundus micogutta]|uniref:5-carboxymethyl-2-hydroxymuconate isomerase n=1 Tax=Mariprofundus micogutta TaxID=1921010 RepID=A0A1L8CKB8_9PROT|nr:5-carboxymethyl-2-hydroxymuconate Delta-isomerase [Mariprofundus micogutta]GAV19352.1 5-carboxymethyl-2-hydroxymuconate isomerase [Mariprofundus micogutta]
MPHIIVEYPEANVDDQSVDAVLQTIHRSIADSGLFKANQIKARAYPFKHFTNAGGSDPYIHIQARIKSGRDDDNKKQLSEVVLAGLAPLNLQVSVVTVEIIDMDRDTYGKFVPA